MKKSKLLVIAIILFVSCGKNNKNIIKTANTAENYHMESLPPDLTYKVIEDKSDDVLEKNQIIVELSRKISIGQIATLADKFYKSKPEQRRFYIFYLLPGMKNGETISWATSHFDPELEIKVLGSTAEEENSLEVLSTIKGKIVGKWHEEAYTSMNYVIYLNKNKVYLMMFLGDSKGKSEQMISKKIGSTTRYDYKDKSHFGEYFIINSKEELEFYNGGGENFTKGVVIK